MLAKKKREFSRVIRPVVTLMAKAGLRPNHLTIMGLLLGFIALLSSLINYWLAVLVFTIAFSLDMFDGALARRTGTASKFGAFFDSVSDKIVETLFISFIAINAGIQTTALFAVSFSIMISYSKHRAECLGAKWVHSFFDRAERLLFLLIVMMVNPLIPYITQSLFTIYTALCAIAILQVVFSVKKQL